MVQRVAADLGAGQAGSGWRGAVAPGAGEGNWTVGDGDPHPVPAHHSPPTSTILSQALSSSASSCDTSTTLVEGGMPLRRKLPSHLQAALGVRAGVGRGVGVETWRQGVKETASRMCAAGAALTHGKSMPWRPGRCLQPRSRVV